MPTARRQRALAFAPTSEAVPSWQALPAPDVAVSQTVQPTNATVGSRGHLHRLGDEQGVRPPRADVVVTDRLPAMTTLISASPQAGSCTGSPTICAATSGPSRLRRSVSIVVTLTVRAPVCS